jgi:hypothetical protein
MISRRILRSNNAANFAAMISKCQPSENAVCGLSSAKARCAKLAKSARSKSS